jgi:hypothetical protein
LPHKPKQKNCINLAYLQNHLMKKKKIRIRERKKERRKKKKEGRPDIAGLRSEPLPAWVTALHLTQPDPALEAVTHGTDEGSPSPALVSGL